jgi:hypothetical protein
LRAHAEERRLVAGRPDGTSPDVPADVEAGVIDPHGWPQPEARPVQDLAKARSLVQASFEVAPQRVQPELTRGI